MTSAMTLDLVLVVTTTPQAGREDAVAITTTIMVTVVALVGLVRL